MDRSGPEIDAEARRQLDAALGAAALYLADEIRSVVGVQAPLRVRPDGRVVAATPAEPGAPPRRVTGALQAAVEVQHPEELTYRVGVFGLSYPSVLEDRMGHAFMEPTVIAEINHMTAIVGRGLSAQRGD